MYPINDQHNLERINNLIPAKLPYSRINESK